MGRGRRPRTGLGAGNFYDALEANRAEANEWTLEESPVAVALIDLSIRCPFFRGTMQELLQTLAKLCRHPWSGLPIGRRVRGLLSVKGAQVAPQLRAIGIDVEFQREMHGRFVTVAMSEEKGRFASSREGRTLIDNRFRAYLQQDNRSVG